MVYEFKTNRLVTLYTPLFFGWTISLSSILNQMYQIYKHMFVCMYVCMYMYVNYSTFHMILVGSLVSVGEGSWYSIVKNPILCMY
jgi:hypothetical protein